MILVKITFLILSFLQCALTYSDEEYHKRIERQTKDLEVLVGRSFAWENPKMKISSTNSKGETAGEAYFKNSDSNLGDVENVAWYWHPEQGFSIIASKNELLDVYGKDHRKPFQFYDILINESGVVVFSFLVDQKGYDQKGYNVCPWLWWSSNEGLHLSDEPTSYQLVTRLNDNGYVLIKEFLLHPAFRLHVKHFNDDEDLYIYEFNPRCEIIPFKNGSRLPPGLEKDLVKMILKYTNTRVQKVKHFDWGSFVIDEFSDNLNIKGHGLVTAEFLEGIWPIFWHIYIRYEICDGNAKFMVEKITEAFETQPRVFTDINNKVIFEKNFSN